MGTLLQYQISNWEQLSKCKSNTSNDLYVSVSNFIQNKEIDGTKISVNHTIYGSLFSITVDASGELIDGTLVSTIDRDDILNELQRYGFYVRWTSDPVITQYQYELLKSIKNLDYDKIRLIVVHEDNDLDNKTKYIVAFNIVDNSDWINSNYSASRTEWNKAILSGSAYNLNKAFINGQDWSWIYNSIFSITELLESNAVYYE